MGAPKKFALRCWHGLDSRTEAEQHTTVLEIGRSCSCAGTQISDARFLCPMKLQRIPLEMAIALLLCSVLAFTQDQAKDKQKLMEIEKAFASQTSPGPQAATIYKQHLYEGTLNQLNTWGQVGSLPKSRIVELNSKPNPSDPDVKTSYSISDLHVDVYGDAALVSYKLTGTETGHKDPALNATDHYGCLDTFVKREGQWYAIGNACAPSEPIPQAEWNAAKKAMSEAPKDVKEAYH